MQRRQPVPKRRRTFRVSSFDAVADPREFARLNRHLGRTRVRVPIAATYPLAKADQAHRRLDRGHVLGKIVLRAGRPAE